MVLGRGFESGLHLKTRLKDGQHDGRKLTKKLRQPNGASHRYQKNVALANSTQNES